MKKLIIAGLVLILGSGQVTFSQTAKEKAERIAAEFSKEKNADQGDNSKIVEARPDIRDNTTGYAGKYEMNGLGHYIIFRQLANNSWEADYFSLKDTKPVKQATLKDIKIESALLTATIHHEDGRTGILEGVFISRSESGKKSIGFGIRQLVELSNGFKIDKAFYQRTE